MRFPLRRPQFAFEAGARGRASTHRLRALLAGRGCVAADPTAVSQFRQTLLALCGRLGG